MNAGKIQAKFRNSTPICLIVEGKEVKRYKSIDFPDALKDLKVKDFKLDASADEKITCQLIFEKGVLPAEFPPNRQKTTWAEMRAAKAEKDAEKENKTETKPTQSTAVVNVVAPTIEKKEVKPVPTIAKEKKVLPTAAVVAAHLIKETTLAPVAISPKAKEQPQKAEAKKPHGDK